MPLTAYILFFFCLLCLVHSYVFFPAVLGWKAKNRQQNQDTWLPGDDGLPTVSILLAAYNEEKVIEQKILSTLKTSYPLYKIEFLIGSDASSDNTNVIIRKYSLTYPNIKLVEFGGRTGKAGIINQLAEKAQSEILILTDANVFFREDTIYNLVKHYHNPDIALVGGNILNKRFKKDGISIQEKSYLSRENNIKYREGVVWGTMIGAFGGCYSIRKGYYAPVPPRFFMDDFYITMNVLGKGKKAINELDAVCYEDVSNRVKEEFRRKVRISIGNFQNLSRYYGLLWPPFTGLAFCFMSHKVLRWFGPFFLIIMLVASAFLSCQTIFFQIVLVLQLLMLLTPVIDWALKRLNLHIFWLRFISHFYVTNLALLVGFFRFIRGVKTNVWRPTERNQ